MLPNKSGIGSGRIFRNWRTVTLANIPLVTLLCTFAGNQVQAQTFGCSPAMSNDIVCENSKPGNPSSQWDISGTGDASIQGFATDISVPQGGTLSLKIKTNAAAYTIDIYRIGYYSGNGARKVASITPSAPLPQTQPNCLTDVATKLLDCGNWAVSASWSVPSNAVSGIYVAKLVRTDTGGASHIIFIVRNDTSHSDLLFQTSDESWQAYNSYGGSSLYGGANTFDLPNRAYKVSYNRPFVTRGFGQESITFFFGAEYPMVRFLESNGYDVTYSTGVDAARNGTLIKNHKTYLSVGHDEYWSGPQRTSVEAARDAGVHMAFFSGNEVFWKTRWENSIDGSGTPNRTMVCYKETLDSTPSGGVKDPADPPTWTGTWRDPRFSPPADGGRPENSLTGSIFMVNGLAADNTGNMSLKVPAADGKMRFWRNTPVASQSPGAIATLPQGTLGYEWDIDQDNGFRPAGAFELSTATYTLTSDLLLDFGGTYGAGNATHHLMMYRAPSGSLVFDAGTVQWSWGLDSIHDNPLAFSSPAPDPNMQQAMINLMADMDAQPATLQAGLLFASKSTDQTPPISLITSPSSGTPEQVGVPVTITGTAADGGNGMVAGVEVSTDGGLTWHPASGRQNWSYVWNPGKSGSATIMSRAVDDSGNIEIPTPGFSVPVAARTCPCSIWSSSATPVLADSGDSSSVEVGLAFTSDTSGYVTGVRFYKSAANVGTHVGHLWTAAGTLLATVTFSGESGSGWQQASFPSLVQVTANTTYVISYLAPIGHYAADAGYFYTSGVDNSPLHAAMNGNGVFVYSTGGAFPSQTFNSNNYWVDVVFSPTLQGITPAIFGVGAVPSSTTATINWSTNVLSDSRVDYGTSPGSLTLNVSKAALVASHSLTLTGLTQGTTYFYRITSKDAYGDTSSSPVAPGTNSFVEIPIVVSVWAPSVTPGTIDGGDPSAVEVGMKFRSDTAGWVSGVRFYKAAANTGSHIGNLWSSAGTLLGTVTFTGETASGWQQANFVPPVLIAAGTTYVVSYFTSTGHYSANGAFFTSSGADNPPLHALANGVDGPNGLYRYVSVSSFPNQSFNAANYWVDLVFTNSGSPAISAVVAAVTATTSTITWSTDEQSNSRVDYGTAPDALNLNATNASLVTSHSVTLTGLTTGTVYYYRVTSVDNLGNSATAPTTSNSPATFTPNQPPPVITAVTAAPGITTSTITWTTDTNSTSRVDYGTSPTTLTLNASNGTFVTSHSIGLTGLATGTTYYFRVTSIDSFGNSSTSPPTSGSPASVTTIDATPPVISSVTSAPGSGGIATISWMTNKPTNSSVDYGTSTGSLTLNVSDATLVTSHSLTLAGLTLGTTYYYSVTSVDSLGNSVSSPVAPATANFVELVPLSFWSSAVTPGTVDSGDGTALEVGMKFRSDAAGAVAGVRFYKSAANTGSHIGNLWSNTGTLLGSVTFSGETASGWQQANFGSPISIAANTTYVLSYFAPAGHYSVNGGFFASGGVDNAPIHALASGVDGPNGVYFYTSTSSFPNQSFNASNYWVDVVFTPTQGGGAPVISGVTALPGSNTAMISWTTNVPTNSTVDYGTSTGSLSLNVSDATLVTSHSLTLTGLTQGTTYYYRVTSVDSSGSSVSSPAAPATANFVESPLVSIWSPTVTPGTVDAGDGNAVEVGVKFRSDTAGVVSGVRFYKSAANTGSHIGNLWSSAGTLLGSVMFTGETASGWQQANFATPISIAANTTYVISYFAPAGHYSVNGAFFASGGVDNAPLHALASGVDGPNGVYLYGAASSFPNQSFNASNYWVDLVFSSQ
jgi:hypothetical protein